jgi:hypothetical protein
MADHEYALFKERTQREVERRFPNDWFTRTVEMGVRDYEYTKNLWIASDYGHSMLDLIVAELLTRAYHLRQKMIHDVHDVHDVHDAHDVHDIDVYINLLWRCESKLEFDPIVEKYQIPLEKIKPKKLFQFSIQLR